MATTPPAPATPAVLTWAREDAGYTIAEAAKKISVKAERVMEWEAGSRKPTIAQLRNLAHAYRRPVAAFFLAEPPATGGPGVPDFRSAGSGRPSPRLTLEIRRAAERREVYMGLHPDLPRFQPLPGDADLRRVDETEIRARLGVSIARQIGPGSVYDGLRMWMSAIEDDGVLVFHMSRVDMAECRGFSLYLDPLPVIVLNGADSPTGRVFTLLHEYGHLLKRSGGLCPTEANASVEAECNDFAARMLLPAAALAELFGTTLAAEDVSRVAARLKISELATAIRLRNLGHVDDAVVSEWYRITKARLGAEKEKQKESDGGPAYQRTHLRNLGDRYVSAVLEAMEDGRVAPLEGAHYLDAKLKTIDAMQQELAARGSR